MEDQKIIDKIIEDLYFEDETRWFLTFFHENPICNVDCSIKAMAFTFNRKLPIKDNDDCTIVYDAKIVKDDNGNIKLILRYPRDYYPLGSTSYLPFICDIKEILKSNRAKEAEESIKIDKEVTDNV